MDAMDAVGSWWEPERRRGNPKDAEGRRATAITLDMFKENAEVWRPGRRGIALRTPWDRPGVAMVAVATR